MSPPAAPTLNQPLLSIIIPTYQERENIGPLLERVDQACRSASIAYEALVVDDDSPDGTGTAVQALEGRLPARAIIRKGERGLASAVLRGFAEARGEYLLVMDADLSHPAEKVPELARAVIDGEAEMAIGSRYVRGGTTEKKWPWLRRWISRTAIAMASPLAPVADVTSGFFCVKKGLLDGIVLKPLGYKIALEILVRARPARALEIPIHFRDRASGESKLGARELAQYFLHLLQLYPARFPKLEAVRKILLAAALCGSLVFLCIYGYNRIDNMNGPEPGDPAGSLEEYNDFNVFYGAGERVLAGREIYGEPTSPEGRYYLYPPAFALYMHALTWLGLRGAAVYWFAASLVMLAASVWLAAGLLSTDRRLRAALTILAVIINIRYIGSDFGNGNANLHVFFFIALGLWALARGRPFAGGLSLAGAALTKVTPILYLLLLVWKYLWPLLWKMLAAFFRKKDFSSGSVVSTGRSPPSFWARATAGMLAGIILFTLFIPTAALGWRRNWELHRGFYESMVSPYSQVEELPKKYALSGNSLKTLLLRYLTDKTSSKGGEEPARVNFASLDPDTVWRLYIALSLLLLLVSMVAWAWNLQAGGAGPAAAFPLVLDLGTAAALMVMISPLSRKAHFVVLLILTLAALGAVLQPAIKLPRAARRELFWALVAAAAIGLLTSRSLLGKNLSHHLDSHAILFWPAFFLWLGGVAALFSIPGKINQKNPPSQRQELTQHG